MQTSGHCSQHNFTQRTAFRPKSCCQRRNVARRGFVDQYILKPLTTAGQMPVLNEGIRNFYDKSSGLWERMWGEHMHHGFYEPGSAVKVSKEQAQIDMINKVLEFAGVSSAQRMVDVGCGIGGSSRYISKKLGCSAEGITLSPVQAHRANALANLAGLDGQCKYQVADALNQPFPDNEFDLVWSLESGEHMPDKRKFVAELLRVAKPGGKVMIVTWCHRNLQQAEQGYTDIRSADWSDNVAPFWREVLNSALSLEGLKGLATTGWDTLKGALVVPLMQRGYDLGVIKFVIISGTKPQ